MGDRRHRRVVKPVSYVSRLIETHAAAETLSPKRPSRTVFHNWKRVCGKNEHARRYSRITKCGKK